MFGLLTALSILGATHSAHPVAAQVYVAPAAQVVGRALAVDTATPTTDQATAIAKAKDSRTAPDAVIPGNVDGNLTNAKSGLKAALISLQGVVTAILAGLFILFMLIAGIRYILAGGSSRRVDAARSAVTTNIEGAAIALLALVIWQIIQQVATSVGTGQ